MRMMYCSVMTQANSEKEILNAPVRSRTEDLPITSSDALPLSYRRLVGAEAIKLGSWDKHPVYTHSSLQTLSTLLHCQALEEIKLSGRDMFSLKELVLNKRSQVREHHILANFAIST